uniref:Fe2OG dioxygenase domain-containing protein n=1 Tax=Kalanchoe fedtschenkoi TaxID=63787 RepID=A0A7N0TVQ8_KALFE
MAKLVSNWYKQAQSSLPEKYVLPPGRRPGQAVVPSCESIPLIDLGGALASRADKAMAIVKAGYEFGFFQVINHGVPTELMDDAMKVCSDFFNMSVDDKAKFYNEDGRTSEYGVYTSSLRYPNEDVHLWRDTLRHPCHPLEDCMQFWPDKPQNYRDVIGRYATEVKKLSSRILDLICEGLGLDTGYLGGALSENHALYIHNYPPCPDPTSTLGLTNHFDPTLITLVQQGDVCGLQVMKDNSWLGVDPIPSAFVVNIGSQLQVISNDRLRSIEHRAVTNSKRARTSIVSFINPSEESIIEPAKVLVDENNPPLYNSFFFKDFFKTYLAKAAESQKALDNFKLTRQPAEYSSVEYV